MDTTCLVERGSLDTLTKLRTVNWSRCCGVSTLDRPIDPKVARLLAEASHHNAQAEFFRAQTTGQLIDNQTAAVLAASAEIALTREKMKEEWDAASNGRNRVYQFTDEVNVNSVDQAVDVLNHWQRIDHDNLTPWRFVICSGGGDVVAGMKLYSTLKSMGANREIITVASGMCASMATIIHQAGTVRLIEPGTSYLIHDISSVSGGSLSAMNDTMVWLKKLNSLMHTCLAEKAKLSIEEIAALGDRKDSWFMPEEVIQMGFADGMGYATQ